jgi:hypothetical protein
LFGDMDGSLLASLTEDQRKMLTEALELRNEMMGHNIKMNALRIDLMRNPSREGEKTLTDYADVHVAPLRRRIAESTARILDEAIDIDKLKDMFPMALSALSQSVNLPLLLTAAGFDPDTISEMIQSLTDYFRSGME